MTVEEAIFTCYAVSQPPDSLTAGFRTMSKPRDLWLTEDGNYAVIKCRIAKQVTAREATKFLAVLRETGRLPSSDLAEPIVVPEAPFEFEEPQTGTKLIALDSSRFTISHVGTIVELLIKKTLAETQWLIDRDLIFRLLPRNEVG